MDDTTDALGRAGELREDLKLELLDWLGDRISGAEDMPLEEIIELNSKSLDVTLDNIIKLLDSATRTAVTEERKRIMAGLPEKRILRDWSRYDNGQHPHPDTARLRKITDREDKAFNESIEAVLAVIAAGGEHE